MAEVLYSRQGAICGVDTHRGAVSRFDPCDQGLRDCVLRASYPVFDLPIFFRRPGYNDVHAIFQVKSVSGSGRDEGDKHARAQDASSLGRCDHCAPRTMPKP